MNTSQKSDADQAFLLPSNVCDQKPDGAVTPSDPPAKALERNRKPTAQEVWDALLEDAIQDE
ncbi:MAG TPA: hypothetical protein VGY54_00220, partial [Polyangiaceae bacterium]|nr:hypothetical protein [Polyangiaceae bacterium]